MKSQTEFEDCLRNNDIDGCLLSYPIGFFPWVNMKWGRYRESPLSIAIRSAFQYKQYDLRIITMLLMKGTNPNHGYEEEVDGIVSRVDNFRADIYSEQTDHFNKRLNTLLLQYGGRPTSVLDDNIEDMSVPRMKIYTRLWVHPNTYPSFHQVEQLFEILERQNYEQISVHELVQLLKCSWVQEIPRPSAVLEYIYHYIIEENQYRPHIKYDYCKEQLILARNTSALVQFDTIKSVAKCLAAI